MNTGVIYSIHGKWYWPLITVSVHTLRQHHPDVPICIMALDVDGYEIGKRLADVPALHPLRVMRPHIPVGARNSGYAAKTKVVPLCPFERGVFLDADTLITGQFMNWLLPGISDNCGVVLTQFADWVTTGKRIRGRLEKWRYAAPLEVAACAIKAWPAVNTGVFGFRRDEKYFTHDWPEMTARNISFICDELAAQLLVPEYITQGRMRILNDAFNYSPVYGAHLTESRIWHFHGGKHLRPGRARDRWWSAYLAARRENIAGICDWAAKIQPELEVEVPV